MCECEGFKRTCHNTMIIEKSLVWSERERERVVKIERNRNKRAMTGPNR